MLVFFVLNICLCAFVLAAILFDIAYCYTCEQLDKCTYFGDL